MDGIEELATVECVGDSGPWVITRGAVYTVRVRDEDRCSRAGDSRAVGGERGRGYGGYPGTQQ